jgi:hypothetical protein
MGRETGHLQLVAPLLLTGGKGADLVIRGNVVLNKIDSFFRGLTCCVNVQGPPTGSNSGLGLGVCATRLVSDF